MEVNEDLESIARNRLNMVKPNEIVYIDIKKKVIKLPSFLFFNKMFY